MANYSASDAIITNKKQVSCSGGAGSLGHPKIYLEFGDNNRVTCPYCSQEFVLEEDS
jgi:uncharacterized Zn-finger protein